MTTKVSVVIITSAGSGGAPVEPGAGSDLRNAAVIIVTITFDGYRDRAAMSHAITRILNLQGYFDRPAGSSSRMPP